MNGEKQTWDGFILLGTFSKGSQLPRVPEGFIRLVAHEYEGPVYFRDFSMYNLDDALAVGNTLRDETSFSIVDEDGNFLYRKISAPRRHS
ncbi:MAG: hypothetical protein ABSE76_00910 [Minisyncoccia bacterium]|jgi:hypothetical protein